VIPVGSPLSLFPEPPANTSLGFPAQQFNLFPLFTYREVSFRLRQHPPPPRDFLLIDMSRIVAAAICSTHSANPRPLFLTGMIPSCLAGFLVFSEIFLSFFHSIQVYFLSGAVDPFFMQSRIDGFSAQVNVYSHLSLISRFPSMPHLSFLSPPRLSIYDYAFPLGSIPPSSAFSQSGALSDG